ncbi:hypothetical protein EJ08DRAFT_585096 [Tothia fuscella]|uniref:RBR-type E3 ubiquitin transferase n=1 Tax=Tothia fuscella TaxID=1048955 RepID=A0A9P4TZM6_9PEZI|nr:hypothetical protein EJ08DRAFT_585096 [Tothia fuscella]
MVINCRVEWVECVTCGEDEIPYLEFSIPITSTCTHDRQTCKACTQRWISTKLDKGDWDKINCPGDCPATLQPEDMRNLATPEQLERYQHLSFRSALGNMPDFVWCMAPGCDSGQIHTQEDGTILNCVACNSKSCVDCNRLWHEGETCEDYKLRTGTTEDHEKASEAEVLKISKECPGCKMRLQKEGGCEHITCECNYQFCWLCLVSYIDINKDGAFAHKPTCM